MTRPRSVPWLRFLPLLVCVALAVAATAQSRVLPAATPATTPADLSRDTLAWVGARVITADDLERRVELMPWADPESKGGADTANVRALEALVAEKLLAQEAERLGLGASAREASVRRALSRALTRDALHRREVGNDSTRADAVLSRVLVGRRVTVEPATFRLLCDSLRARMRVAPDARVAHGGRIRILTDDLDDLADRMPGSMVRTLVTLPDGKLTLGDVLEDLRFYDFSVRSLAPDAFARDLNGHLKFLVERDLLAAEGAREHLDRLPDVVHEVETWTDAWRADLLVGRIMRGERASAGAGAATTVGRAAQEEELARRVDQAVAALASRTHVRIEPRRAQAVALSPQRMLTRRVLGFGGSILAAPGWAPEWGWATIWRGRVAPLP